jgi:hypothetical protein
MFAQAPSLILETATIGNTGQVSFKTFLSATAHPSSAAAQEQYSYETEDRKYVAVVDPDTILSVPRYNAFAFEVSIRRMSQANAIWYVYNVRAEPVGKFADVLASVSFTIRDGRQESVGTVKLPLHSSFYEGDLLRKQESPAILEIKVSDGKRPTMTFQNKLENLSIHVTNVEVRPACDRCWDDAKPEKVDINIRPAASAVVPLNIKLNPLSAMMSTAFVLRKESPQDLLSVTVTYNVDQGGMPKEKQFDVPVRFSPSIWQLVVAVIIGGIVGTLLKRVLDREVTKITWGLAGRIILLAAAAEFFAAVAASFDSKLILLSFDMDPRQVIPAVLLAIVVTGGPTVTKWALGVIRPPESAQAVKETANTATKGQ